MPFAPPRSVAVVVVVVDVDSIAPPSSSRRFRSVVFVGPFEDDDDQTVESDRAASSRTRSLTASLIESGTYEVAKDDDDENDDLGRDIVLEPILLDAPLAVVALPLVARRNGRPPPLAVAPAEAAT